MLRFRPEIIAFIPYVPVPPLAEAARELGVDVGEIAQLGANEHPLGPVDAARRAMRERFETLNRYPDNEGRVLTASLAGYVGVAQENIWLGAGSSEILRVIALAVGGAGTSAVYGDPSFALYEIASIFAGTTGIAVPLGSDMVHDLDAMVEAIRPDTVAVYICNPNNPTGTFVSIDAVADFLDRVPRDVLVVVDEAYHEFADHPEYSSAVSLAVEQPNLIVARTFSKVFGLAALRIGYAVSTVANLTELRKAQAPFSVGDLALAAAHASLGELGEIADRAALVAEGRHHIERALADRGIEFVPSQANFVYFRPGGKDLATAFFACGVVLRDYPGGWVRVSIGTEAENLHFMTALDEVMKSHPGSGEPLIARQIG